MNRLFIIALLAGGLYLGYQTGLVDRIRDLGDNAAIEHPVFARMSLDIRAEGREIEGIVIGKMRSMPECEQRTRRELRGLLEQCPQCRVGSASCTDSLATRELAYFEQRPTHLTYLHGTPGKRDEREFALIFWGLTVNEARFFCTLMERELAGEYAGALDCIREHDV
jgi:hypothetical protein